MVKARFIAVPVLLTTALLLVAGSDEPAAKKDDAQNAKAAGTDQKADKWEEAGSSYCPQYLMGEYNGVYFYYAQQCDTCNVYSTISVSKTYNCGGCCYPSPCCGNQPGCSDQIPGLGNAPGAGRAGAADSSDPFEVVRLGDMQSPKRIDVGDINEIAPGQYHKGDIHFCAPAPKYQATEFLVKVKVPTLQNQPWFYFRCFQIVNLDDTRQQIMVGHETTAEAATVLQGLPSVAAFGVQSFQNGFDQNYGPRSTHNQRVAIPPGSNTYVYLFGNSALQ